MLEPTVGLPLRDCTVAYVTWKDQALQRSKSSGAILTNMFDNVVEAHCYILMCTDSNWLSGVGWVAGVQS